MVIRDYNNKKYIELTEDWIIFYKWYGKVTLKRNKVKGAFIFDDMIIKVLYGNKVKSIFITNVKTVDKLLLDQLIGMINKENTICSAYQHNNPWFATLFIIYLVFINIINSSAIGATILGITITLLIFGWPIYFAFRNPTFDIFIYNYKEQIIELTSTFTTKHKKIKVNDENLKIALNKEKQYIIRYNNRTNMYILTNIKYPSKYKNIMKELYNIKNPSEAYNDKITFCYYCGSKVMNGNVCSSCGQTLQ